MRVMQMGGLVRVNGIWRSRRDVPLHLRAFLPPPWDTAGRNKTDGSRQPVWTLTKSTGTGNKTEAQKIARRENHQGAFDRILACAQVRYEADEREQGIDWIALDRESERWVEADIGIAECHDFYRDRQYRHLDPIAVAVDAKLNAILHGMGIAPAKGRKVEPLPFNVILDSWKLRHNNPRTFRLKKQRVGYFEAYLGHNDAARVTPDDVNGFLDTLLQPGSGKRYGSKVETFEKKQVENIFTDAKAALRYAHKVMRKLPVNPGEGITFKAKKSEINKPRTYEVDPDRETAGAAS
jgi:hypothetical protein